MARFGASMKSEFGRQVAVDFESDADFHECGSCPVHSRLRKFHVPSNLNCRTPEYKALRACVYGIESVPSLDWRKYAALTSLQTGTALGHSCFQVSRESWTSPAGEPHGYGRSCPSRWFPMKALPPARSCCPACPESRRQSFGHWGRSFVPLQGRRSAPKQVALRLQAPEATFPGNPCSGAEQRKTPPTDGCEGWRGSRP
jgi:hypothetical protein